MSPVLNTVAASSTATLPASFAGVSSRLPQVVRLVLNALANPTDDPKVRQPDITKARRLLGWEPTVEVEDGLCRTIDWCRKLVTQP